MWKSELSARTLEASTQIIPGHPAYYEGSTWIDYSTHTKLTEAPPPNVREGRRGPRFERFTDTGNKKHNSHNTVPGFECEVQNYDHDVV